ncbi:MAG: DUF805 domain-containing protein [Parvularcula sp.]|jgi:uncharacterized membrane protein YhaH (DUF805 family)|nr:DUF805 domain-containing protein [Parvularcula sp.]
MTPSAAVHFLTDTQGRLSRRGLLLGAFLPFVLAASLIDLTNDPWITLLGWALMAWPLFVATPWRRMHDMGRKGRWNLLFYGFYLLGFAFFFGEYTSAEGGWSALFDGAPPRTVDDDLTAGGLGGLSTVLIFLPIHLFWLYLIPSQASDNRYGPPPARARNVKE